MARKGKDPASSSETIASPPANDVRRDAGKDAEAPAGQGSAGGRTFGGLTPREAALRKAAKDRERKANGETGQAKPPDLDVDGQVIAALEKKAMSGDVPAARELREWRLRRDPGAQTSASLLALLTPEQRHIVDGWLAAHVESPA